jgi:hypothetical protein
MHKNPAYILYSDPIALNKWGFLYVQFKAAAYWFIIPWLAYILIKAMFVGLAQTSGKAQAIALVLIEAALLVGVSVLRPWMDKKTNGFNIAIAAVNFLSAVFLLMFTEIFKQPVSPLRLTMSIPLTNIGHRHRRHGNHLLCLQCRFFVGPSHHATRFLWVCTLH